MSKISPKKAATTAKPKTSGKNRNRRAAGSLVPKSSRITALLSRPDAFVQTMTEKLLMYAIGRSSHFYDMPAIRTITRDAARSGYKFSSLVMGIVNSDAFQMRVKKAEEN